MRISVMLRTSVECLILRLKSMSPNIAAYSVQFCEGCLTYKSSACFGHIASSNFLLRLPDGSCQPSDDRRGPEVQATVRSIIGGLQHALPRLLAAMKQIKARRRKGRAATGDTASDGGEDAEE